MSDSYIPVDTNLDVQSGFAFPSTSFEENGIPIVRMSDLKAGKLVFNNTKYVSDKWLKTASPFTLKSGDFLMGMSGSLTNFAVVSDDDIPSLLNQRVGRLKLKNTTVNYNYVCYWLKSEKYECYAEIQGEGAAQKNISAKQIGQFLYRDAHLLEQNKIASILQTIDQTIEKTEALIEKYQQIKAGLMHDLFTRGIAADGKLRPPREQAPELYQETPIGWIPRDWAPSTLRLCLIDNPTNGVYKPAELIGEGALMVGQTAFTKERSVDFSLCRRGQVTDDELRQYGIAKNNILVTRVFATVDGVGLPTLVPDVPEPSVYESNMMRLRVDSDVLMPRLLFEWLRSPRARNYILTNANASNQVSVNQVVLNKLPVPLMNEDEQRKIVIVIEKNDKKIADEKDSRSKLKQMKSGLMHDLLTGKVPVAINDGDAND